MRPLMSCYSLAIQTQRKLLIVWPKTIGLYADLKDLFPALQDIKQEELLEVKDVSIYGLEDAIENEAVLYGNNELWTLSHYHGYHPISQDILKDTKENIIICTNNFIEGAKETDENYFLKYGFTPHKDILQTIEYEKALLNLSKKDIGVHARLTDFIDMTPDYYIQQMKQYSNRSFYITSDSQHMEKFAISTLGEEIKIRKHKRFVEKLDPKTGWAGNTFRSLDNITDALVDMYLLAETDFKIYNYHSTFAHIVQRLQSCM